MVNQYIEIPIGRAKNITGQRFGKLTVLYRTENQGKSVVWVCQCDCGNITKVASGHLITGHTTSCGCHQKTSRLLNITGQKFGKLTVLNYEYSDKKGHTYWKCQCECGVEKIIRKDGLISGMVISCGCESTKRIIEEGKKRAKDLTNQRFGKLVALNPTELRINNDIVWFCQCDCGNTCHVASHMLIGRYTSSCGCIKTSIGESNIQTILKQNNIEFEKEKTFKDFIYEDTKCHPRYDFYLPHLNRLIEFDGKQHFQQSVWWHTAQDFKKLQCRDKIKNNYALKNNIELVRIPYWERDNITLEMLLGDQYLIRRE